MTFTLPILFLVLVLFLILLIFDFIGPREIYLQQGSVNNIKYLRASDLIIQEYDKNDYTLASRGLILYRLKDGDDRFIRVAHVPSGLSLFWLNNFSLFRRFTNKPENLVTTIAENGDICAMSAGYMWHKSAVRGRFRKTIKLPHYGAGIGRGILSTGLVSLKYDRIYFGEYFRNSERTWVKVFKSADNGHSWEVVYQFEPGSIRHIHGLQEDPYTGRLWICSGDHDNESMIGWSDNDFQNINQIGNGSQIWRTSQLVFTEEAVYWGTDTGSIDLAGIYRWDKVSMELTKLHSTEGAILFGTRLKNGTIVFSSDREGFPNEKDKKTRLFILNDKCEISIIELGTWKHWEKNYRFSFAMLRFQRNQGSRSLAVSVINQKEFQSGDLLIFPEQSLNALF